MPVSKFPYKGRYEGSDFTIDEVISSLAAQRLLIKQAVGFLEALDPNYDPQKVVIRVLSIEEGSLIWDLLIEIWGTYQKELTEQVTGSIEKATGVDIPEAYEPLVAIAVMAVVYWGLRYAYDRVARRKEKKGDEPPKPSIHIEGNYNTVIQLVADKVESAPEWVDSVLNEKLYPDRIKVVKAATDFVRPAKHRDASISVENAPDVPAQAIAEVPSDSELSQTSEPVFTPLEDATMLIRGTDRDSHQAGWRGLIEDDERFPKRLPIRLSPTIDPEELADLPKIRVRGTVEGERFFDGTYVPRRVHLYSYTPDSD